MSDATHILGISAFYHDSAAALIRDGEIVAAAQEERFSRVKHDHRFPARAVEYCLEEGGVAPEELALVAFYDKPWLKFERLLETYLSFAPAGIRSFLKAMPLWLKEKLWMGTRIGADIGYDGELIFPEHHQSHAASAFFPSPYERAAFLTLDGVGEWATASWGTGAGNEIDMRFELRFPHSLGLLYSAFTYYTGFRVNSGEYKVMGLASYGRPRYVDRILGELMDLKEDGSFRMNMEYFNYCQGLTMTSEAFHELFGAPPREPETELTQREMDLARSVQAVTEEVMLRMARHVRRETGERYLCLAGGVALNCVGNGEILREDIYDDIWIQPAAGDAGGALGAALFAWHQVMGRPREAPAPRSGGTVTAGAGGYGAAAAAGGRGNPAPAVPESHGRPAGASAGTDPDGAEGDGDEPRRVEGDAEGIAVPWRRDRQKGSYLGPGFDADEIAAWLDAEGYPYQRRPADEIPGIAADHIVAERVVGWFSGRMEFGPRALGARSILGDARSPKMQSVMNLKIKFRESFRPFAPSCLEEDVGEFFELDRPSPYMLLVAPVRAERRVEMTDEEEGLFGIDKLHVPRSDIPAVTHVDYSARVQTVSREDHRRYWELIREFKERTGYGIVVNTSFNVRGEPIVCTPEDAYLCFMRTDMDVLVLEECVLRKEEQPELEEEVDWRELYALD